MKVLGISAYYHDSAGAILDGGCIVAAAQEERFSRVKHDACFPAGAVSYCLDAAGVGLDGLDAVVFYDKPLLKFERLLETYLAYAPRGFKSFARSMPVWLKEKLFLKSELRRELGALSGLRKSELPPLYFSQHHLSHAASAYYPGPFESAAVLCMDGVGEWATTTAWHGRGGRLEPLWQIDFPHSLGLLYSAFTYFCGFRVNSGEYKLMGLAPYGEPRYAERIREHLIDIKTDGSFRLDMRYFNFCTGLTMTNERFAALFGGPPRRPESELTTREMDLAASIQQVTEEVVMRLARTLVSETGEKRLCLAGGVALNCVANGRLADSDWLEELWVQPAAGDAGGALGAALQWHHGYRGQPRRAEPEDSMQGALLGPSVSEPEAAAELERLGAHFTTLEAGALDEKVASLLEAGEVVGWFQGRMEFGPRALGNRSILGDPRNPEMQRKMNLKIKFRESFRPFAPAVLAEHAADCFEYGAESPYMLVVAGVREALRLPVTGDASGLDKLHQQRSTLPAVTHVDCSARIQTVSRHSNPRFRKLLEAFYHRTGCPVLVNTSFNVRGEPIVCTVEEAWRCFMRTDMDYLVVGRHLLAKEQQPDWTEDTDWRREFALD